MYAFDNVDNMDDPQVKGMVRRLHGLTYDEGKLLTYSKTIMEQLAGLCIN